MVTLAFLASLDGQAIAVYLATLDILALVAGLVLVASLVIAEAVSAVGLAQVAFLVGRAFLVILVAVFLDGVDILASLDLAVHLE